MVLKFGNIGVEIVEGLQVVGPARRIEITDAARQPCKAQTTAKYETYDQSHKVGWHCETTQKTGRNRHRLGTSFDSSSAKTAKKRCLNTGTISTD